MKFSHHVQIAVLYTQAAILATVAAVLSEQPPPQYWPAIFGALGGGNAAMALFYWMLLLGRHTSTDIEEICSR